MESKLLPALKPEIIQGDLFICDLVDAPLKDDQASMEHPVFTISKKPDMKPGLYEHNGYVLRVSPSEWGRATMYDKDILIYATSKLMQAKNRGETISPNIIFEAQEALRFMHRTGKDDKAGGTEFRALEKSLRRLKGTMLETNITTNGVTQTSMFGLIDTATVYRESITTGRVLEWGIKLSDWLFQAIQSNEVLTLHPDYFRLRTPTEKRVYELARRHCQGKNTDKISLEKLQKKVGSVMPKRMFRFALRKIQNTDHLPDYHVTIGENDIVTFSKKQGSKVGQKRPEKPGKTGPLKLVDFERYIDTKAHEFTRKQAGEKNLDWHNLKQEFINWCNDKGHPDNFSAAFIGFVKNKKSLR